MIRYECDKCGLTLEANDPRRFIVKFEIYAAAGHVDLTTDAKADSDKELSKLLKDLAAADPNEVEDQTYRSFRFDVCDSCRRDLLAQPLG